MSTMLEASSREQVENACPRDSDSTRCGCPRTPLRQQRPARVACDVDVEGKMVFSSRLTHGHLTARSFLS